MIYAIVLTLEAVARLASGAKPLVQAAESLRSILILAIVPLALMYIYVGTRDYSDIRYGSGHLTIIDYFGWFCVISQIAVSIYCYYRLHLRNAPTNGEAPKSSARALNRPAIVLVFAASVVLAILQAILGQCDNAILLIPLGCMLFISLFTIYFVLRISTDSRTPATGAHR